VRTKKDERRQADERLERCEYPAVVTMRGILADLEDTLNREAKLCDALEKLTEVVEYGFGGEVRGQALREAKLLLKGRPSKPQRTKLK
jgi:hypothetical protein